MAEILSEFGHLVGLAGGNNIQATTMPTYSSVPLGTIVQYIGTTTADYINGYFYKATATGWEQHDTQPASNADNSITAFKESSPALAAHAVDDYIRYNNVTYIVTAAIAIGDTLTVGTNIAVPTLDEGTVIYTPEAGGGSAGGGHVIVNPSGTEMEQRASLQFVDANVTDDSTNDKTKIENIKVINSESELASASDGMYMGSYDDEADGVISADMVMYDSETTVEDELDNKVDKVTGKGLSTNDYDNTDKAKVDKIDDTTTAVTGNPIGISGLKSNQLAKDPIITFEPIQDLHGQSNPYPAGGGKNRINASDITLVESGWVINQLSCALPAGTYTFSFDFYGTGASSQIQMWDENNNLINDNSWHVSNGRVYNEFIITVACVRMSYYSNAVGEYTNFMIAAGLDTVYAPYENICPISGYDKIEVLSCGKNLIPNSISGVKACNPELTWNGNTCTLSNGVTVTLIGDNDKYNAIKLNGTASSSLSTVYFPITSPSCNNIGNMLKANITYTASSRVMVTDNITMSYFDTFSISPDWRFDHVTVYYAIYNGDVYNDTIIYPQVELGSTATTYEPYNPLTDIQLTLGQTIYGGTLDVEKGILMVDRIYRSWKWSDGTEATNFTNVQRRVFGIGTNYGYDGSKWLTNVTNTHLYDADADVVHYYYESSIFVLFMPLNMDGNTEIQLVHPLATPSTIQLTPHEISLLKDYAYASTNGTNMQFSYKNGELASLGDVAQLGQTVNELGDNLLNVVEDVTSKFVIDSTNVYQSSMQVLKIGKMVFINGLIRPQTLTSLQDVRLFDITDSRLLPLVGGAINITTNFVPIETEQSTTLPLIVVVHANHSQLRTLNNGAYGGITNITTSSLIIFSGAYICRG